jgi:hypothetical protein
MTTQAFIQRAGPTARAMHLAYQQQQAGNTSGTIKCPLCGAPLKFQWFTESNSSGQCASAGCVR